jgi:hypothetical protein
MSSDNIRNLDPWSASSLLQKAIRRGELEIALSAASALLHFRGRAIWRRLVVIAFEDIGVADIDLVLATTLQADKRLNGAIDFRCGLAEAIEALCSAPKNREAEVLFSIAAYGLTPQGVRDELLAASTSALHDVLVCPAASLEERAVSAWLLSGLDTPSATSCDRNLLLSGLASAGLQPETINVLKLAARIIRSPMVAMAPLLWLVIHERDECLTIVPTPVTHGAAVDGILLAAFDKHVALGKQAIRALLKENPNLRSRLAEFTSEYRVQDLAEIGVFHAEGALISTTATWSRSKDLARFSVETDLARRGCPPCHAAEVVRLITDNLGHLDEVRRRLLLSRKHGRSNDA